MLTIFFTKIKPSQQNASSNVLLKNIPGRVNWIYRKLANVSFPSKSILGGGVGEMIREELQDYIARYQTWDISLIDPWISTYFISDVFIINILRTCPIIQLPWIFKCVSIISRIISKDFLVFISEGISFQGLSLLLDFVRNISFTVCV